MKKLLFKYIRQCRTTFLLLLGSALIYAAVFSLYDLETEGVLYAAVLTLTLVLIVFAVQFVRFAAKHEERQRMLNNILLITEELPEADTPAEEDYLQMIDTLRKAYSRTQTQFRTECGEAVDFYTTWVHQMKTPISVMRMLLQTEDTDHNRELLAELFRIEQYTDMVLCYFRLGDNASDFVFETVSLDKVIRTAIRKYAPQFIRKHIQLSYTETDAVVLTDEKWLGFVLEQLLSNAVKYTNQGSITISADAEALSVSDTGIGIAAEDLPRIFEKGFTGYNGRANQKSTGLGLYLCEKACKKLSHCISAESEVGKGSTFRIAFSANERAKD